MVAAPLEYGLKPKTAYAAVCGCSGSRCGCGALCCDGWTEFCCTLTGQNRCPDGTVAGGWWKVDGSQFCGGGPRYYLDCNAQCGGCGCGGTCSGACSGTGCGCAGGDCNNRKTGCVRFRYGNCHQEIACLGPIVCRVVTCVAPWIHDPACTTASRSSEATRNHHRACVNEPFGALEAAIDVGGAIGTWGWAIDQVAGATPTHVQLLVDMNVAGVAPATVPRADVARAYPDLPGDHGFEATLPTTSGDHLVCAYAVDPDNGARRFLGIATVTIKPARGALEFVSALGGGVVRVQGWVANEAKPSDVMTARILVPGVAVIDVRADQPRPDVAAAHPSLGPNHGFTADITLPAGVRQICVDGLFPSGAQSGIGCLDVVAT